ncbi:hypothetical protein [Polyangium jinanense]|uniref:Uncharacterized protein n=1 Tax=Polyangium jinanense TaxID=2829994 RepID=A0A9X3X1X6_9BACT|nr:hypothetical protein [Polyangium jinanense]MDC3957257.1 hypothetical protein [Polyangium jinanense]MDC3982659.1 hypothetical protein [Polyangium jinanense]
MRGLAKSSCVAIAAASLALVAGAPAEAAGSPSFSSVPEARVPEMLHPKDAPDAIPAGERIDSVRVDENAMRVQQSFATVVADGGRCVAVGAIPPGVAPSGVAQTSIRVGAVLPMRVERLVERKPGEAELEIVDAWLDARTSSIRQVVTTRVSLTTLAKGPASYTVYGFRKGSELQVVMPSQERIGYVDPRGQIGFTQCGHLRIGLDGAAKNGAMIVAAGRIRTNRAPSPRRPAPLFHPQFVMPQSQALPADMMMRVVQVSVSMSRTKRDREPLLSVSVGWAEDDEGITASASTVDMGEDFEVPIAEPAEE